LGERRLLPSDLGTYDRHHLFQARQKPTLLIAFDFALCFA
jgi:hypothetical protein